MKISKLGERKLLKKLSNMLDVGDDVAHLPLPDSDSFLTATTDMLYEETHVLPTMSYEQIGKLIVTVNLSDLAASGSNPIAFLLSYGGPDMEAEDFQKIISAAKKQAERNGAKYVGGDLNSTPKMVLSGTAIGLSKKKITRTGANPGDLIGITGDLGSAHLSTFALLQKKDTSSFSDRVLKKALEPEPRVSEGLILKDYVSSMTDVSDGLSTSLYNLSTASCVNMQINEDNLPVFADTKEASDFLDEPLRQHVLHGEGDYELLFTVSPAKSSDIPVDINWIGRVGEKTDDPRLYVNSSEGTSELNPSGYEHFKK